MLILEGVTYAHPNREILFSDLYLRVDRHDKAALIGNNGAGKSCLLKLLSGSLQPLNGTVKTGAAPYYMPQVFGQLNDQTVAEAIGIDSKLKALKEILGGEVTEANLAALDDDWSLEEKCQEAFHYWQLSGINLSQTLGTLSGGQKTKVFLAGIRVREPEIVLLDEPSNHLDQAGRRLLYDYIATTEKCVLVVSHDRTLLNLFDKVYELTGKGITMYGGNYDFYTKQKAIERAALEADVNSMEKALRRAKEVEREQLRRQQKLDARGKKKQEQAGLPTISMNTFRNNAEKSTGRQKQVHAEKVSGLSKELDELRSELPAMDKMKINLDDSSLHRRKVVISAKDIGFSYNNIPIWEKPLSFQIRSGERIAIDGPNGSGKTTLMKMLQGTLPPAAGSIERSAARTIYIDQDYSLLDNDLSVYDQAQQHNGALQEHEVKIRLNRFLFTKEDWEKKCASLSGGERMRLILCCLTIAHEPPDILFLDEPTNNLDIQNTEIMTAAIRDYSGTVIVVSHDSVFLQQLNIGRHLTLP